MGIKALVAFQFSILENDEGKMDGENLVSDLSRYI